MKIRKEILISGLIAMAMIIGFPLVAEEKPAAEEKLPSVSEVMEKLDNLYRSKTSHGTMEMTVVNQRGTRTLTIEQWSMGQDKALMVIRAPSREAGSATLKLDEGLWNYAPRADRLIRIPSGLLSDSWMGSHFSNDDLMRETSYESDFTSTLAWATHSGARYLEVTMVPKPEAPVVWEKIVYRLTAEDWLPVQAAFFDEGKPVRTMEFSDIKEMGGKRLPSVMTLKPQAEGEYTKMEYKDIKFDVEVDESLFSQRGLRRVARTR
ncbi:MAG: outer membrane lipoprotein-sorting protein [Bradymonadaceae bacterium]